MASGRKSGIWLDRAIEEAPGSWGSLGIPQGRAERVAEPVWQAMPGLPQDTLVQDSPYTSPSGGMSCEGI